MKLLTVFFALVLLSFSCEAQRIKKDTLAPYKRTPVMPAFDLLQQDSIHLTKDKIDKKANTLLMYFSPTCDHCKHQIEDMIKGMDSLKNIQIIMSTYQPFEQMQQFYTEYKLSQYPNIKIGRDAKYFLPPYFRMKSMPYLALYDKKGNLITTFEGNHSVTKLVNAFNKK